VSITWNDEQARCALALSILSNEPDAHRILGDLLEEHGDTGLAQWARSKKSGPRKKLDIALAILQPQSSVPLAVDFLLHALNQLSPPYELEDVIPAVEALQQWSETLEVNEVLKQSVECLLAIQIWSICPDDVFLSGRPVSTNWQLGMAFTSLANCVMFAARSETETDSQASRHLRNEAALQARNVAKYTRDEVCNHMHLQESQQQPKRYKQGDRYGYHRYSSRPYQKELLWQITHTRHLLEESSS
jgi:hypothetical protein